MNKDSNPTHLSPSDDAEMLPEYDFSYAVRGNPRQHLAPLTVKIETPTADRQIVIQTVEVTAIVARSPY